jgi:hypothetical protein
MCETILINLHQRYFTISSDITRTFTSKKVLKWPLIFLNVFAQYLDTIEPAPIKPKPPALLTALAVYNHYSKSFRS